MRHPDPGQLRACADGELPSAEQARIEAHLETCARCRQRAAEVRALGERVQSWMAHLERAPARHVPSPQVARRRLDAFIAQKENAMRNRFFARRYRPAWIAAALVLVFAVGFTLPPVRAVARDLLALFRVQKIELVQVDPQNMPDEETLEAALSRLKTVMEDKITVQGDGEPVELDPDTASEQAGFPVRLPAALDERPRVVLEPYTYAQMQIDLPRLRALLNELGYDGQALPDSLDGAEVSMGFGPLVTAAYGSCQESRDECTVLIQMPSPQVDAPAELELNQLGQAYLQLLGLSPADAVEFSSRIDWATTLVLPVPSSSTLSYRDVTVDGVTGTVIHSPRSSQSGGSYLVIWIRGDVVYALSGTGPVENAVAIADSLQ